MIERLFAILYTAVMKNRVHLLPNVITAFGLSCGLFLIFKMSLTPSAEIEITTLTFGVAVLLLAAFADLLDGAVARAIGAESAFGGYFDSLSDAVTFGVAPSVVILKTFSPTVGSSLSFFLTTSAMIFSVCGVLRLVRFNVASQISKEDTELLMAHRKNFTGLPIPAAASAAVSANLFLIFWSHEALLFPWVMCVALTLLGYLMVCRLKFPSLKTLHLRVGSFRSVFLTVIFVVLFFYGLLHYFPIVFFLSSWGYIAFALLCSLIRKIGGGRPKTLEEFEPEPDELGES